MGQGQGPGGPGGGGATWTGPGDVRPGSYWPVTGSLGNGGFVKMVDDRLLLPFW